MSQFPFSFELRAAGVVSFNSSQKQVQVLRLRLAVSHPSGEDLHPTNKDPFVGAPDLSPGTPTRPNFAQDDGGFSGATFDS